jgi:hypothetical protein
MYICRLLKKNEILFSWLNIENLKIPRVKTPHFNGGNRFVLLEDPRAFLEMALSS